RDRNVTGVQTCALPIFIEQKCLACHGCYDAPCQLKFETPEGLERGAHKQEVYNGSRLRAANTTRLGYDAHTEEEWRDLGFYSVRSEERRVGKECRALRT